MKVAVASSGNSIESNFDENFGRCPFFIIYDTETKGFEAVVNEGEQLPNAAGPKAAEIVAGKDAEAVLAKKIGGKAEMVLEKAGIEINTEYKSCLTVKEALEKYLSN